MMQRSSLTTLMGLLLVSACSTPSPPSTEMNVIDGLVAKNTSQATQALRELSEAAGQSRVVTAEPSSLQEPRTVAAPLQARTSIAAARASIPIDPMSQKRSSDGVLSSPPPGLDRLITIRWTGDLEELLARIATETGWKIGDSQGLRVTPVTISINVERRVAFEVLRDIGAMTGESADVLVSSHNRTISVRYPQR